MTININSLFESNRQNKPDLKFPKLVWHKNKSSAKCGDERWAKDYPYGGTIVRHLMVLENCNCIHLPVVKFNEKALGIRTIWLEGEEYENARMMYFDEPVKSEDYPEFAEAFKHEGKWVLG